MVIDTLRSGGKERRLLELLKGLQKENVKTGLVILSERIEYKEIYNLPVELYTIKRKSRWDPSVFRRLGETIGKFNPDIIQVWELMASFYVAPLARYRNIKLISAVVADAPERLGYLEKKRLLSHYSFALADVIIGNSRAGLSAYRAPEKKSVCIYNGIDPARGAGSTSGKEILTRHGLPDNVLVIGMVASFNHYKDYETYIEAAKLLLDSNPDLAFFCIGDGPDIDEIQRRADGLESRIIFTGRIDNVEEYVRCFDVGVLSTYTEGISNAIIEYMLMGKPVVATEGGGTRELVEDGVTGFMVPQRSAHKMADRISTLLTDEALRKNMGTAGRERILSSFNLDKMTENYLSLYRKLASQ